MTFTAAQNELLAAPLNRSSVKERKMAGRLMSYIEGWHAIAEANRIFGFDGWSRETVMLSETSRDLVDLESDRGAYQQWRISYIARVRITIGSVVREGTGYGSGMGKPGAIGDAVEGAIKEAETDAMKRALMTFGNQFGLALYDKEQTDVLDDTKPVPKPTQREAIHGPSTFKTEPAPPAGKPPMTPQAWAQMGIDRLATFNSKDEIHAFEDKYGEKIAKLAESLPDMHKKLVDAIADRHFQLDMT